MMTEPRTGAGTAWGLFPLRAVVGIVFLLHGGQKFFVYGVDGTTNFMAQMGIPLPAVSAVVVATIELLGGAALITGLGARWAALLLAGDMAVAILAVRLRGGFFAPTGVEFELTLFAAAVTLALIGPGRGPLDRFLPRP